MHKIFHLAFMFIAVVFRIAEYGSIFLTAIVFSYNFIFNTTIHWSDRLYALTFTLVGIEIFLSAINFYIENNH